MPAFDADRILMFFITIGAMIAGVRTHDGYIQIICALIAVLGLWYLRWPKIRTRL